MSFEWISYRANVYKANRTHGNEPERASTNREKRSSLYPPVATSPDGALCQITAERVYTERENSKPN